MGYRAMTTIRLDRLLSNLGYCSRKEAAGLVKAGRLALADALILKADQTVALADVRSGALTLDGEKLDPPSPLTAMMHKPAGYSCSHAEKGRLIYDLLPERWKARSPTLSSIGRLDKESTGQLLLTDDGDLLHRIIHPKSHAKKHYAVTLEHALRGDESTLFASGTFLMKDDTKPLKAALWTPESEKSGQMILEEGRYHQIRRMFETIGNTVVTLHRTQTGGLVLGPLEPGQYEVLGEDRLAMLFVG
jgi:16S rRNA pseudouridine516 synthase